MIIKVKRKLDAVKITRFSSGDNPSLEFPDNEDVFNIPIEFLAELGDYFEPYFPMSPQEKKVGEFMLGEKKQQEA